jgi:hypothetical protein
MGWFSRLLRRGRLERELDAELAHHVTEETRRLVAEGAPPEEARSWPAMRGALDGLKTSRATCDTHFA